MSLNNIDKDYDEEYVNRMAHFLPRNCPHGVVEAEKKRQKVLIELEDWELFEEPVTGYKFYKHPFSKIKFGLLRMHFRDKSYIDVPRYELECDDADNSGYKIIKENGREKKVFLSELTYIINSQGIVVKHTMDDFFQTRNGKRYIKYQDYKKKRFEKKRVYAQEKRMVSK
ncbi:MAG: hypothetical protein CXT73_04620 [Methanobacteriota archaeon]|nr:MAG: hypothetical protein CXT73_04620 [Euryarchaeota archaeon]